MAIQREGGGEGEGRISITVLNHYNVISLTMNVINHFTFVHEGVAADEVDMP
jgi:hypothetical protein